MFRLDTVNLEMFADINVCEFVILEVFSYQDQRDPTIRATFSSIYKFYIYIKCGDPDQTGTATILPCLFAHNLVFDTYDLKFELN